jgi:hypothetical protein
MTRRARSRARGILAGAAFCHRLLVSTNPPPGAELPVKERVETILREHLDARRAATVVRIASRMWLRTEPETLEEGHLLGLTQGLAPILQNLLGSELTRSTLDRVLRAAKR